MRWLSEKLISPTALFPLTSSTIRHVLFGFVIGFSVTFSSTSLFNLYRSRRREKSVPTFSPRPIEIRSDEILDGVVGLIGNTPLIRIRSLSNVLGVDILGKAEFLNPGGSVKDRVALRIIDDAERQGLLHPHTGSRIFEGTVGSTGISLSTVARARGYATTIVMPDDIAREKIQALLALGADVEKVRPASIVDKKQFVNAAKQYALDFGHADSSLSTATDTLVTSSSTVVVTTSAERNSGKVDVDEKPRGFFADQFESKSNYDAHLNGTGPEIWKQTNGRLDAFVSGAGTGGTIAGVGQFLKTAKQDLVVCLADPEGSGLYNKVKYGVMFDLKESEGKKRRHQVDTVVEGIGINRLTRNLELALPVIDEAYRITDTEAVAMSRYLVENDGLFVGSSSACNLFACVKLVKERGWKNGEVVVTILCDSGSRHYSKFWNDEYLRDAGIEIDTNLVDQAINL